MRGLGRTGLNEVVQKLVDYDLHLQEETSAPPPRHFGMGDYEEE
jgi:hypothetical protein